MALDVISVIVPAHNCAPVIARTLASVEMSIAHFRQHAPDLDDIEIEVIAVNDSSSDRTADAIEEFIAHRAHFRHVSNTGRSASSSRNAGVRAARGNILCFLDGDDLYLPLHLLESYRALVHHRCGYIRSLIRVAESIHPDWHDAIANSSMINLCVRRDCHEFLEGVPDWHLCSRQNGQMISLLNLCPRNEDVYYNHLLVTFFHGYRIQRETVEYLRYPGNALDRQLEKFRAPWGAISDADSPDELQRKQIVAAVLDSRVAELIKKKQRMGKMAEVMPFKV